MHSSQSGATSLRDTWLNTYTYIIPIRKCAIVDNCCSNRNTLFKLENNFSSSTLTLPCFYRMQTEVDNKKAFELWSPRGQLSQPPVLDYFENIMIPHPKPVFRPQHHYSLICCDLEQVFIGYFLTSKVMVTMIIIFS